jgi:hypothetical protein
MSRQPEGLMWVGKEHSLASTAAIRGRRVQLISNHRNGRQTVVIVIFWYGCRKGA